MIGTQRKSIRKGGRMTSLGKCAAVLFVIAAFGKTNATTMFELTLKDLSVGAQKIVQAKVTAVIPQWSTDRKVIDTYIRMNIVDDLLGSEEDNEIIIKQPGGKMGALTLKVSGSAEFKVGEDDIVFLERDLLNPTVYRTMGLYQGKYTVHTDPITNTQTVAQDTTRNVTLLRKSSTVAQTGNGYDLSQFKQLILQLRNQSAQ